MPPCPPGPSVFVPAAEAEPPEEDVQLFDATRLTVMQRAEREEEAAGLMGGITAFSRQKHAARRAGASCCAALAALA